MKNKKGVVLFFSSTSLTKRGKFPEISQVQIKILFQTRALAYSAVGSCSTVLTQSRYPNQTMTLKSVKQAFPLKAFALEEFIAACFLKEYMLLLQK